MYKLWIAIMCMLLGCEGASTPAGSTAREGKPTPKPAASGSVAPRTGASSAPADASGAVVWDAIRLDRKTFLETRLGKLRFDKEPPFKAEVIEGESLRKVVAEMNALEHVRSAGSSSNPNGTRIERSEKQFFRIMRNGWLSQTHGVTLRSPVKGTSLTRYQVVALEDGRNLPLGAVDVDDQHYLRLVSGPEAQRSRLGGLLEEINQSPGESVDTAPPKGAPRGSYGRAVDRGTPLHFAMMRDRMLRKGALLIREGRPRPDEIRFQDLDQLSAQLPSGLMEAPLGKGERLHLSGPPGAPLGLRIAKYRDIAYDAASLESYVTKQYGSKADFKAGQVAEVDIAARKLLALPFIAGTKNAKALYLVALWPARMPVAKGEKASDRGVVIEAKGGTNADVPKASSILDHKKLGVVLDSLFVDHERL